MEGVVLDREAGDRFDVLQHLGGQDDIKIADCAALQAGDVAVGISAVAVKPAGGAVEALDHASGLESFEVLVNGGMADVAAHVVELLVDVAGAQVAFLGPEQIEHHAALAAEAKAEVAAAAVDVVDAVHLDTVNAGGGGAGRGGGSVVAGGYAVSGAGGGHGGGR